VERFSLWANLGNIISGGINIFPIFGVRRRWKSIPQVEVLNQSDVPPPTSHSFLSIQHPYRITGRRFGFVCQSLPAGSGKRVARLERRVQLNLLIPTLLRRHSRLAIANVHLISLLDTVRSFQLKMPPDLNSVHLSPKPPIRTGSRVSNPPSRRTSSTMPPPSRPQSTLASPGLPSAGLASGDEYLNSLGSGTNNVTLITLNTFG
jgi:hypothetical protein